MGNFDILIGNLMSEEDLAMIEKNWYNIGILKYADLSSLAKYVGVYRMKLHGELVYIGRAIEYNNGGFRKRLRDYLRDSDSARKHKSGQLIYEHAHELQVDIIKTGTDREASDIASKLEKKLISKYSLLWNIKS